MAYPEHRFSPEDFLQFFELHEFTDARSDLVLDDDDLYALQVCIMLAPDKPPVISGTGGLRKIRFAPSRLNLGKSGAYRICYAYFAEANIVLLVLVYTKNEQDNLSKAQKNAIRDALASIEEDLCN
ncbi:MAG: hypothetical protein KDA79_17660 [Planctomycetaceae bacterium]|nr:hypothetical protein [Planctomycetaceae bacterium]